MKGVTYAVFAAAPGTYAASYAPDDAAPVVSSIVVTPRSTSATITWTTDEPASSQVSYGTSAGSLTSSAGNPGSSTSHTVTLTGLSPSTVYSYRITSIDLSGNSTTSPEVPALPAQLTTLLPEIIDTTTADFGAGTFADTLATPTGDGAVALGTSAVQDFDGSSLPATFAAGPPWTSGGSATVSAGSLSVDGTPVRSTATYGPGTSVEFLATFAAAASQHLGLGTDLDTQPWAFFSTRGTADTLYARTQSSSGTIDTPITPPEGSYLGSPHRFRVEWGATSIRYYVDETLVATHALVIASPMQVLASDFDTDGSVISIDQLTVSTHAPSGTFTSRVLDAGSSSVWGGLSTTATTPAGTGISYETRSGNIAAPDGTWSAWAPVGAGGAIANPSGRYLQYRATLTTTDPVLSPELTSVTVSYQPSGTINAIVVFIPGDDPHEVTARLDGVPVGSPLGSGGSTGPLVAPVGDHTMTVTGSGDTDLSKYIVVYWGNCTSTGVITVSPGSASSCAALIVNLGIPIPSLSVSDPVVVRPASGTAQAVFTVTLSGPSFFPVSVGYATHDGSATTANGDYTARSGRLTFGVGSGNTQTVSVPISATDRRNGQATFDLALSSPSAASIADPVGTATLINRLAPPLVTVRDVNVVRSTSATTAATFTVALSAAPVTGEQVSVVVSTVDGSAIAGTDYTAVAPTTLVFSAGERLKTVTVPVEPKPIATPTRAFSLALSSPSATLVISDPAATASLRSSGVAAPPPSVYVSDAGMLRPAAGTGTASFTVFLGSASTSPITVSYATADGSATAAGGDYISTAGTLTFAPGETSKTVSVTVSATQRHSVVDDFGLTLSSPTGAVLGDGSAMARLTSRNGLVTVRATDAAAIRSTSVAGSVTVAVSLSSAPAVGEIVTVSVSTADGSAIAGVDYAALAATSVTFAAGETTKYVTIPVSVGAPGAPRRSFSLVLSSPSANALVADASAVVALLGP